jgi:hypothetical protein
MLITDACETRRTLLLGRTLSLWQSLPFILGMKRPLRGERRGTCGASQGARITRRRNHVALNVKEASTRRHWYFRRSEELVAIYCVT